jgi:hypothetical protein
MLPHYYLPVMLDGRVIGGGTSEVYIAPLLYTSIISPIGGVSTATSTVTTVQYYSLLLQLEQLLLHYHCCLRYLSLTTNTTATDGAPAATAAAAAATATTRHCEKRRCRCVDTKL